VNDSVITYDHPDGKFQRGTSTLRPTGTGVWLAVGGVGMVVGEAAFQATWGWSLAAAVLASAVAVVAWRSQSRSARALSLGLVLLSVTLTVAGWRSWRAGASTDRVADAAAVQATDDRDRLLASAAAGALQVARNALQRTASSAAGSAPDLRDLLGNGPIEQGLVVMGGDTVIALAGPQRTPSVDPSSPGTLIRLPFAHLLVVSLEGTGGRRAQVSLLLDADRALPTSEPSLAGRAGRNALALAFGPCSGSPGTDRVALGGTAGRPGVSPSDAGLGPSSSGSGRRCLRADRDAGTP